MPNENKELRPESSPAEALIARGDTLVKFQDETMMSVAVQRPRSIDEVRTAVIAEIESFPEFADRYFYSIPHKTQRCNHDTGRACPECEYVEGPSIHAALALHRYWGNCASSWSPLEETDEHFWCVGTFVDYERNTKVQRPFRADKTMKLRSGKIVELSGDRLAKAINAAGSKAHRNAILAGIPDPLKLLAFTVAKKLTVGDEPDKKLTKKQILAIEQEFAKFEVALDVIERKLGKKAAFFTMADRARLLGLRNALMDGEAKESLFGATVTKTKGKKTKGKAADEEPVAVTTGEPIDDEPIDDEEVDGEEPPPGEALGDEGHETEPRADEPDPFTSSMFDE